MDQKQVKYFNKRTFVTTASTPREVREAEAAAGGAAADPDAGAEEDEQHVAAEPARLNGRARLLSSVQYGTVHGGFFYCAAQRRQVLKNARLLLRPTLGTVLSILGLFVRTILNAAYTLQAAVLAVEYWLKVSANMSNSASGSAGREDDVDGYAVLALVAALVECATVWLSVLALCAVLAALAIKVCCNRGDWSQTTLTIAAYRSTARVAAFSLFQYVPTLEHQRKFRTGIRRMRRAVARTRTAQQDFQTDCDSRLLTGCCVKSCYLVLTVAALLSGTVVAAMHLGALGAVLTKVRAVGFVSTVSAADWSPQEWLALIGLVNQIFSITDADEQRKAAMLRLLLTPHESVGADAILLQETKQQAFEASLVEALTEDVREFADAAPRAKYTLSTVDATMAEVEDVPPEPDVVSDDAVLGSEVEPMSTSVAVCVIMTMRSEDLETILRRVAQTKPVVADQSAGWM